MTILKEQTRVYSYKRSFLWDRDDQIITVCKGKKVLHIGATDWPNTKEKEANGSLLHKKIMSVASEVLGIDNSKEGIAILTDKGINNVLNIDLNDLASIDFRPDIIIFGETIEHVMNLKVIFDAIKNVMNEETRLIISTPNNNYSIITLLGLFGYEMVHYDHNVLFSLGTLTQLLEKNGFVVESSYFTYISRASNSRLFRTLHYISKCIGFIIPWKGETLLFITKISNVKG